MTGKEILIYTTIAEAIGVGIFIIALGIAVGVVIYSLHKWG